MRFWAKFKDFSPVSGMKRDSCMISCADPNMAYTVNKRRFQPFSDNAKRTNSYSRLFPRICYVILPALSIRTQEQDAYQQTGQHPSARQSVNANSSPKISSAGT